MSQWHLSTFYGLVFTSEHLLSCIKIVVQEWSTTFSHREKEEEEESNNNKKRIAFMNSESTLTILHVFIRYTE